MKMRVPIRNKTVKRLAFELFVAFIVSSFSLLTVLNLYLSPASTQQQQQQHMSLNIEKRINKLDTDTITTIINNNDANKEEFLFDKCNYIQSSIIIDNLNNLKEKALIYFKKYFTSINSDKFFIENNLCDITFTIKTTIKNHYNKLKHILDTWVNEVPSKVRNNEILL